MTPLPSDPARSPRLLRLWRLAHLEAEILAGIAVLTMLGSLFIELVEEVFEGETGGFDRWLLLALRSPGNLADPIGPSWFEEAMRDITALGSTAVLTLMILAITGFLVITHKRHSALLVVISVAGGTLIGSLLKIGFDRPRPDIVPHATVVTSASFPSGHSMMSAVVYLTLGALLARTQTEVRVKAYILGVAVLLALLVGVSRVYLGVHWPTDVMAGWALGSSWAVLCWLVMVWLQARGRVETASKG